MKTKNKSIIFFNTKLPQTIPLKKIIAVTKNQPKAAVSLAIKNKIYKIGENRIQEAENKFLNFAERDKIELHLIGNLQTNKVKKAVKLFDIIQTVSRIKTIDKINIESQKINKKQKIYLQINTSKDPKKKGIKEENVGLFYKHIQTKKNIKLMGVMTILKKGLDKKSTKIFYKKTKKIQEQIKKEIPTCKETSMGMSNDYKIALSQGATEVRIGTALFGERKKWKQIYF